MWAKSAKGKWVPLIRHEMGHAYYLDSSGQVPKAIHERSLAKYKGSIDDGAQAYQLHYSYRCQAAPITQDG